MSNYHVLNVRKALWDRIVLEAAREFDTSPSQLAISVLRARFNKGASAEVVKSSNNKALCVEPGCKNLQEEGESTRCAEHYDVF